MDVVGAAGWSWVSRVKSVFEGPLLMVPVDPLLILMES